MQLPPTLHSRRALAALGALAIVAGGSGAALAANGHSAGTGNGQSAGSDPPKPPSLAEMKAHRQAFIDDVAKRLNVSSADLEDAFKGAAIDDIDQAASDGKLTQKQADEIKKHINAGEFPIGPPPPPPHGVRFSKGMRPPKGAHLPPPPGVGFGFVGPAPRGAPGGQSPSN